MARVCFLVATFSSHACDSSIVQSQARRRSNAASPSAAVVVVVPVLEPLGVVVVVVDSSLASSYSASTRERSSLEISLRSSWEVADSLWTSARFACADSVLRRRRALNRSRWDFFGSVEAEGSTTGVAETVDPVMYVDAVDGLI